MRRAATSPSTTVPPKRVYPANIEYDPSGYGTYNHAALSDPNVGAVDINLNWYAVEPQAGKFDFAPADQEVAAWVKQGKKVTLELRFQHETNVPKADCTSDGWLPSWEVDRIPTVCEQRDTTGLLIPDYFDHVFQTDWRSYVATVAHHYAASPYKNDVTYARVALGLGAESFPLEPCYSPAAQHCSAASYRAAVHQLQVWGYTAASWLRWQEGMLAYYKKALTFTKVIYPINQMLYPRTNRLNINTATGNPVNVDVAEWAAAHGFGIGQQGLNGPYTGDYANFNEIIAYVRKHFPSTYLQFQTVAEVSNKGTPTCSAVCLVKRDVQVAELDGAHSIEWYSADDANPSLQPSFAQFQRYVNAHH